MLDVNGDYRKGVSFNEHAGAIGLDARSHHSDVEPAPPANDDQLLLDTLDFTRVKLTSFRLLNSVEERNLALQMANAGRAIALLTASCHQSARELLNLLETAMGNTLDKSRFPIGERYFELRSELAHLLSAEGNARAVPLLVEALQAGMSQIESGDKLPAALIECISTVDWPGPLMLALTKRYGSKAEAASTLELAIDEHFLSSQIQLNPKRLSISDLRTQFYYHANTYLDAREILVKHNIRLVFHVAKRYAQRADHMLDLIQEGAIGLIRAADKFRPVMGYRFSTYAYQWIASKIRRSRVNLDRVIAISPDYNNDLIRLSQWAERQKINNVHVSTNDLLKELGISKDRLDSLIRVKHYSLSMDDKVSEEEFSYHAKLAAPDSNFAEAIADERSAEYLSSIMQKVLTERECYVINERFGRLNSDYKTLQKLSEILGISRERIRQLESDAIEKLRDWMDGQDQSSFKP